MKRDMDLVRLLLLELESRDEAKEGAVDLSAYSEEKQAYHRHLIWKAGLTRGFDASTLDGVDACNEALTWEGHDFLDAARNETVWRKAKEMIRAAGVSATIEVMKSALKRAMLQQLGFEGDTP